MRMEEVKKKKKKKESEKTLLLTGGMRQPYHHSKSHSPPTLPTSALLPLPSPPSSLSMYHFKQTNLSPSSPFFILSITSPV